MDRFEAMRTFLAGVDGGSLSAASRALRAPLATVSRRVSDLEARLGAQLLVRTSRRLQLTEAGAAFAASARRILDELDEAERTASGEYRSPRGELSVTAPVLFGKLHLAPIVHEFLATYPDVSVRLLLVDAVIDLVDSQVDLALRIGQLPDSALMARRVGEVRWLFCASPDDLARNGMPSHPTDLAVRDTIGFEGPQHYRDWPYVEAGRVRSVAVHPRFSVNTADAAIAGAAAGLGIARVMSYQAAQAIDEGAIVPILTPWSTRPIPVHLVFSARAQQPLKLRAFLDFVTPRIEARLTAIQSCCGD
jgi:DNA-binding transcriptional LysR family regulator